MSHQSEASIEKLEGQDVSDTNSDLTDVQEEVIAEAEQDYREGKISNEERIEIEENVELDSKIDAALSLVKIELVKAMKKFPSMGSAHGAYAVLLEEVDELWDEVKKSQKNQNLDTLQSEAVQTAAMATRFLIDVCLNDQGMVGSYGEGVRQ